MKTAWVILGRNGDVINALPLLFHEYQCGNKPTLIVGEFWSGIADGISYADKLVWKGVYSQPLIARDWAQRMKRFDEILVPQCYGQKFDRKCDNFCEEAWCLAGMGHLWGQLPLVFDRRNKKREKLLIPQTDKPIVLVNTIGISSPFRHGQELLDSLSELRETHTIIDLSQAKAEQFFDLIGLYEAAQFLVTIDSGTLHLAEAVPGLGVIALISDSPDSWHGSPERGNHVLRIRYKEFQQRKNEIVPAIISGRPDVKIVHVWSKYNIVDLGAAKRHRMARITWEKEMDGWINLPIESKDVTRTARTELYDFKDAPYLVDLIDTAANRVGLNDIIVLTNDDTCVSPGLTQTVKNVVSKFGAMWGARREHKLINHVMTNDEIMRGRKHVGADIFAFTKAWWRRHGHNMPDMLFAFENWDYVLRTVIEEGGGREAEGLCYHEIHTGDWTKNRSSAAAKHNQNAGGEFFNARK